MSKTYKGMFVSSTVSSIKKEKMLESKSKKARATNKEKSEKDVDKDNKEIKKYWLNIADTFL